MNIPHDEMLVSTIKSGISNELNGNGEQRALSGPGTSWLKKILSEVPAAIALLTGPDHRFSYVNEFFLGAVGHSGIRDLIGVPVREALKGLNRSNLVESLDEAYQTERPVKSRDLKMSPANAGLTDYIDRLFDFTFQPVFDSARQIEGVLVLAVDVTDRMITDTGGKFDIRQEVEERQHRLQTALDASQRLAAIVESSDDAIISKDLNGVVTSWNPCAERMFGYTAEEMIGSSIRKVIPPEVFKDEDRIMSAVGQGLRTEHFETTRQTKSGERIEISLTLSPVFDETAKILGVSSISRDISQQKKAERALHTSEKLATVGRLAATIAHEINNPLEAVMNLTFLAQNHMEDEEGKIFLEQAQQELQRVGLLTKQTLGFYRENKGARKLNLGELVTPLVLVFSARARNKQITIETEIRGDPPVTVIPGEIRQLFANLLNNSIDAVRNRGHILIRLSAATEPSGRRRKGARLTVADDGPGISPEVRQRLFEPFFTTKRDVGTGLGLWVTSNILLKHEGSIRVRSSVTAGKSWTVFSVFIPAGLTLEA
jgi:PAS domain S-box-containing protein